MHEYFKKYQQWLADFTKALSQAEQQQVQNLVEITDKLKAYLNAGKSLTADETTLFIETLKRQWQEYRQQDSESTDETLPSLWPEALWQQLSLVTDKSQLEWQELLQDFKHQGIYYQGEVVGMARYRCCQCQAHVDYMHPAELLRCPECGGVQYFREGLPV